MRLLERLHALERDGRPIRVAVVGAGQMGSGLVRQIAGLPGMRVAAVSDLVLPRALDAAVQAGLRAEVVEQTADGASLLRDGWVAAATEPDWLITHPAIDAVLDATGDPDAGARLGLAAIAARKPLITMNVEADVTVGPILASLARDAGVVYTLAAGDEPSVLCEMVDWARLLRFEVVCAGKGKNNRLDPAATAHSVAQEAAARGMSPRMLAAFVDGTKTMAEMAALANATGLRVDTPGMHGPNADLADLLRTFVPRTAGGILHQRGVVEYAIGDVAPGVFLIVSTESEPARRDLAYLKVGDGPYYLFHRPFHLASFEAPLSAARAVLHGEVTMASEGVPVADCVAVAKRDLEPDDVLDGIGGETVHGLADDVQRVARHGAVPIGLVGGARMLRHVAAGSILTRDDVALDESATIVQLRRRQDEWVLRHTAAGVATG